MKALVIAALLAACNSKGRAPVADFGPKKVTVVERDGITVPVPAGYRDSSELSDAGRRADVEARLPGAAILISEKEPGTGVLIGVSTLQQQMHVTPQACIELATGIGQKSGGKIEAGLMQKVSLGQACKIDLDAKGFKTSQYFIPIEAKVVLITCSGGEIAQRDTVCSDVANSIGTK